MGLKDTLKRISQKDTTEIYRKNYRNSYWGMITFALVYWFYQETVKGVSATGADLVFWTGIIIYFTSTIYYTQIQNA